MYTQFFGNFLVEKKAVTKEQLLDSMHSQNETLNIYPALLAVYKEMLTGYESKEIQIKKEQSGDDFYTIAQNEGYLTTSQIEELKTFTPPHYLMIAQYFVQKGIIDITQMADYLTDYESYFEIMDLEFMDQLSGNADQIMEAFSMVCDNPYKDSIMDFYTLLFNDLIRSIGPDFKILKLEPFGEYYTKVGAKQTLKGAPSFDVVIDMDDLTAIEFASKYIGENIDSLNEYVTAALEEFINQHNGLFIVNQSNSHNNELELEPPVSIVNELITPHADAYFLTLEYDFGYINVYLSAY